MTNNIVKKITYFYGFHDFGEYSKENITLTVIATLIYLGVWGGFTYSGFELGNNVLDHFGATIPSYATAIIAILSSIAFFLLFRLLTYVDWNYYFLKCFSRTTKATKGTLSIPHQLYLLLRYILLDKLSQTINKTTSNKATISSYSNWGGIMSWFIIGFFCGIGVFSGVYSAYFNGQLIYNDPTALIAVIIVSTIIAYAAAHRNYYSLYAIHDKLHPSKKVGETTKGEKVKKAIRILGASLFFIFIFSLYATTFGAGLAMAVTNAAPAIFNAGPVAIIQKISTSPGVFTLFILGGIMLSLFSAKFFYSFSMLPTTFSEESEESESKKTFSTITNILVALPSLARKIIARETKSSLYLGIAALLSFIGFISAIGVAISLSQTVCNFIFPTTLTSLNMASQPLIIGYIATFIIIALIVVIMMSAIYRSLAEGVLDHFLPSENSDTEKSTTQKPTKLRMVGTYLSIGISSLSSGVLGFLGIFSLGQAFKIPELTIVAIILGILSTFTSLVSSFLSASYEPIANRPGIIPALFGINVGEPAAAGMGTEAAAAAAAAAAVAATP